MKMIPRDLNGEIPVVPNMISPIDTNVQNFKNAYGVMTAHHIYLANEKRNMADVIRKTISERQDVLEQLGFEALQKYPDLKKEEVWALLPKLDSKHPLWSIFIKYQGTLKGLDRKIATYFKKYRDLFEEIQNSVDQMTSAQQQYEEAQSALTTDYVPATEIIQELEPVSNVDFTDDATIMEEVSALDLLDEEAALSVQRELSTMVEPESVQSLETQVANEKKPINKKLLFGGLAVLGYLFLS